MAITKVVLAKLSPTMDEGTIVKWTKNEGDPVKQGDVLAEIETDKANMEMEALGAGVLRRILVPAGGKAPVFVGSYGISVGLAVRAMRILGAARQSAFFATAPFIGAVAAVPLLGEAFGMREIAAGRMRNSLTLLCLSRVFDLREATERNRFPA